MYEIVCRNTLGFNTDAAELYGMPIRKGRTQKTTEDERALFENALANMGSAGYILLDAMDDLELVESGTSGNGYKIYESLESRCEKKISKILLGHADALDSTSGKLGATQGEDSPVAQALTDIQSIDVRFLENNINTELLPRLREMGIAIPDDLCFMIKNDEEREAMRRREDESNKVTAEIAQVMKNAGLQMAPEYFEERTGIPTQAVPTATPPTVGGITNSVKNRLNEIYR
jgi:phage gp29-like protein